MSSLSEIVRFGTRIMPSKREVLIRGPTAEAFEKCSLWSRGSNAGCSSDLLKKYPTISVIDSCVSDKTALLAWQEDKVEKLGLFAFKKHMSERAAIGTRFHKAIEDLLTSKKNNSLVPLEKLLSTTDDTIHGYIKSIYSFIESLPVVDCIMEGRVIHYDLFYTGRFDAVILLPTGPCLIDWKTTSERSAVSMNHEKGRGLKGLYGYPRQVAAYIGAFHNDPSYMNHNMIKSGSLVMAHDSGADAVVHDINTTELQDLFQEFVDDLRTKFWRRIEEGERDFICNNSKR